jgi:hypothetical protein
MFTNFISLGDISFEIASNNLAKGSHGDLGVFEELEPRVTAISWHLFSSSGKR